MMRVVCPVCDLTPQSPFHSGEGTEATLNFDDKTITCSNGHTFSRSLDGIPNLLPPALIARLEGIARYRELVRTGLPTITTYESLPYSLAKTHFEWRHRAQSASIVLRHVRRASPKTVLEIGGWNGWLTHHLAKSADVLAVDFFADSQDGLGAMQHYAERWGRLQMDITDLTIIGEQFDMVVINNGLHLLKDPLQTVMQAKSLVADGGMLMVLELPFYRNPSRRLADVQKLEALFQSAGGEGSLFLYPTKGYLDMADRRAFVDAGLTLRPYPRPKAMLKAMLRADAPAYAYGVYFRMRK